MEPTGRDDEETESSSYTITCSSRSGTIVSSTAYTSGASLLSSGISTEAAALLESESELRLDTPEPDKFGQAIKKHCKEIDETTLKEKRMKSIESLVQEFILGSGDGGMSALERWFSELGIRWVLHLDVKHPPWRGFTWTWITALEKILETIRLTESFFPDHGHGVVGIPGISEEEEVESGKQASLDPVRFALFFQETMSRMLVFVDVMFSESLSTSGSIDFCFLIHSVLSKELSGFRLQFHSSPPAEVQKIEKEMVSLLSAKQGKAFDAIWSYMEKTKTGALKSIEEYSSGTQTPEGSVDIHGATTSLMYFIETLLRNKSAVALLLSQAASLGKYVPRTALGEAPPLISLITEMVSCLEEKLIAKSELFIDKGLGLLFLLNNSNYILEHLQDSLSYHVGLAAVISSITPKLEHYTESYIQVSWEPMLACLSNPTLRLVRKYSPMSKFESEFQKTYTTQKLSKVPYPGLRTRLRIAVLETIIPAYTKYIEDNKVINPKFTPQELEEMLQELFEG